MIFMSNLSVQIVKTLSVTLTRDKQDSILHDFDTYANATNFAIKSIFKNRLTSPKIAYDSLYDVLRGKFVFDGMNESEEIKSSVLFGGLFPYDVVSQIVTNPQMKPIEVRQEFAERFAKQYINDVIKTASVEITRHRKMAKLIVNLREKTPHFKHGVMIFSGFLVEIDEKTVSLLTLRGQKLAIPFDKRSRNREAEILKDIATGGRKFQRVRFTLNKEGYLNIDIRLPKV